MGMNFRTRKEVVVFDVVVGVLSYVAGTNFRTRGGGRDRCRGWVVSYVVGTNFHTRKAVVVFDVVVGLYRMLWV